ncbi:MAG TPA: radical SAM protein [Desulfomonilia bacterium]
MKCSLCPIRCGADRSSERGLCGAGGGMRVSAVVIHKGEEPPLVTGSGSGAIFFPGCPLKCPYCQNSQISHKNLGCDVSPDRLSSYMIEFQEMGCSNINLVTPTHYADELILSLDAAKSKGLVIPVVLNSSGYEDIKTLKMLSPHIDIYLMDMRYGSNEAGLFIGGIPDYWARAMDAVEFAWREKGPIKTDKTGRALSGLIVRHLLMPGMLSKPFSVLDFLACLSLKVPLSLLSQYNPRFYTGEIPEMKRAVTYEEYQAVLSRAIELGFETIYAQDIDSQESYAPDFTNFYPFGDGINLLMRDNMKLYEP